MGWGGGEGKGNQRFQGVLAITGRSSNTRPFPQGAVETAVGIAEQTQNGLIGLILVLAGSIQRFVQATQVISLETECRIIATKDGSQKTKILLDTQSGLWSEEILDMTV